MLDSLSLNPFKFSDAGKKKDSPFSFLMLKKDNNLFDGVTGTPASCTISGARWGIVNGVVSSFAANMPPVEDKGLRGCPAFTQLAKYTEDLTNAAWVKSGLLSYTIIAQKNAMNVWQLTEAVATSTHLALQTGGFIGISDNSLIGISFIYKGNGRDVQIAMRAKDGTYPSIGSVSSSGSIYNKNANAYVSVTPLGEGYYKIFSALPVGVGENNPYIYAQMYNGTTGTYLGDGVSGVYIGQPILINFGVNGTPFIPPYVPNNTTSSVSVVSEAATSTTGTSFDLDLATLSRLKTGLRGPNAQGHIELEFESNVDSGWLPDGVDTYLSILTCADNNARGLLLRKQITDNGLVWRVTDMAPTTVTIVQNPFVVGQTFKISLDYGTYTDGTQKMRLTVNGVKSSVAAFSGSFGAQDLRFFYGNTLHAGWIKTGSLKFIPKPIW